MTPKAQQNLDDIPQARRVRLMTKNKNITPIRPGDKFGRLTVIGIVENSPTKNRKWKVECICGAEKQVWASTLRGGQTKSCGCLLRKYAHIGEKTTGNKLYGVWSAMKDRCNNKNNKEYKNYGSRGISVCKEWNNSYAEFSLWARKSGYKEGLTIDRRDKNNGYKRGNCEWVTRAENTRRQSRNTISKGSISDLLLLLSDLEAEKTCGLWPYLYDHKSLADLWCEEAEKWFLSKGFEVIK